MEGRFIRTAQEGLVVRVALSPYCSRQSEEKYIIGLVEDITEKKTLMSELAEVKRKLAEAEARLKAGPATKKSSNGRVSITSSL